MIRATAPGRCGLVGNPTDGYGGTVLSSSLSERAVVEITPAREVRIDICGHEEVLDPDGELVLDGGYTDVAKAVFSVFEEAVRKHRFHLKATTTIPMQAGLAGSTAMLTAILGATLRLLDLRLIPYEIAETVRDIEFRVMRCVCGFQDAYMTVFGGLKCLELRGKDPLAPGNPIYGTVESLEPWLGDLPLILANTGVCRHSGSVHTSFRERWIEGDPEVVRGYERIAELAREAKKAMLSNDWVCVGTAMNENHAIQRDLGGSGEANERLIDTALKAGALGAKLAGAGQGGTIIAVHDDLEYLGSKLQEAGAVRILRVVPSEGLVVEEH